MNYHNACRNRISEGTMVMVLHVRSLSRRLSLVVAGLGVLVVALAGFAAGLAMRGALANDDEGVLYACVGERSGAVRMVAQGTACLRGETLIQWNVEGPTGPQGLTGAPGATGATGARGSQGSAGPAGPAGPQGLPGPAGALGPAGPEGPEGSAGPAGAQGPIGPPGEDGATGSQGPTGPQGAAGAAGAQGEAGASGPAGAPGISNYEVIQTNFPSLLFEQGDPPEEVTVLCGQGRRAFYTQLTNFVIGLSFSAGQPTATGDGWTFTVRWDDDPGETANLDEYSYVMICADVAT